MTKVSWYDIFSNFYDQSVEKLYVDARKQTASLMTSLLDSPTDKIKIQHTAHGPLAQMSHTVTILDAPCGTGQGFSYLLPMATGGLYAVDLSEGMLRRAKNRAEMVRKKYTEHYQKDAPDIICKRRNLAAPITEATCETEKMPKFDVIHTCLGFTALPAEMWETGFYALWEQLKIGGWYVIVDVYAEKLTWRGRMVNLVAGADITRKVWAPLQKVSRDFQKQDLPSLPEHGGQLFVAIGRK